MLDLKACAVCFNTNVKLFNMDYGQLRYNFNTVSGLQTYPNNGMPAYLCVECCSYVRRSLKFRHRCQRAHLALQEILHKNMDINQTNLEELKCKGYDIASTLSYVDLKRMHYEEAAQPCLGELNMTFSVIAGLIPVSYYSAVAKEGTAGISTNNQGLSNNVKVEYWMAIDNVKLPKNDDQNQNTIEQNKELDDIPDFHDSSDSDSQPLKKLKTKKNKKNSTNKVKKTKQNKEITKTVNEDGMSLVEEYATLHPLSLKEAKAAMEVNKLFSPGKHPCNICGKPYVSKKRLEEHKSMHEKYLKGTFCCELCKYYYKTDNLLKSHMTEKHLYKYICTKCPEVNFDRVTAKRHYLSSHYEKSSKKGKEQRPDWLCNRGVKRKRKGMIIEKPVKKRKKKDMPEDYLIRTLIGQEEQYRMVWERRQTRNYTDADYKCELCFRGFKHLRTYNNHMKKHDPAISGGLQCDMCKMQFESNIQMHRHMVSMHMYKYMCRMCDFVTPQRSQAEMHYRWHKNATYKCPYCEKEFKKPSTRGTHIRLNHPSMDICNLCGHSFVSKTGLDVHKRMAHSKEEMEKATSMVLDPSDPLYCADCNMQFLNQGAFETHLGSSNKHASTNLSGKNRIEVHKRTDSVTRGARKGPTTCNLCGKQLANHRATRKHYEAEHPGAEYTRYMCDVCGHTTRHYANLLVHRRKHTKEKPYSCPHCDRKFSALSSRNAHIFVHTGEKPHACPECSRRFTQKGSLQMHIKTVHMKIPYPPWDKKNKRRRREMDACSQSTPWHAYNQYESTERVISNDEKPQIIDKYCSI